MGIKKIARPMNKAKNAFVKWLKENGATHFDGLHDNPSCEEWDYYIMISAFIGDSLYTATFMVWRGSEKIDYSDEENSYDRMSIDEFLLLIE